MAHYLKNDERNGLEIYFDGKPSKETIELLKDNRWRWFPAKSCWYNFYSEEHEEFAQAICNEEQACLFDFIEETVSTPKSQAANVVPPKKQVYKTSKLCKDNSIIERDLALEKSLGIDDLSLYYYVSRDDNIRIIGEVLSNKTITKPFKLICTLYDEDDDILETEENMSYGSGLVTSIISPNSYFDRFPFSFFFWGTNPKKIKRIKIVPEE